MSDIINKWSVLRNLSQDFVTTINFVYIFGENGKQVIVITNDDNVYSFGDNDSNGCLGLGHTNPIQQPTKIAELCGKQVIHIEFGIGYAYVIALTKSGHLYAWGNNGNGELGIGINASQSKPYIISAIRDKKVSDIKCGSRHTLALTVCSVVYVWGNKVGNTPTKMKFESQNQKITSISSGLYHALALTNTGNVYYWGDNGYGQCGNGSNYDSYVTTWCESQNTADIYVKKIACGPCHSMILSTKGTIYCFGENGWRQCGDGTKEDRNIPIKVSIDVNFIDIAATKHYSISVGLTDNGFCFIWGRYGQQSLENPIAIPSNNMYELIEYYSIKRVTYKPIHFKNSDSLIMDRIRDKFNRSQCSDIAFKVEDKHIYAQKAYLTIVCKHFEDMFAGNNWIESNKNEIEIKDHSYSVYYAFIKYLYTNTVDITCDKAIELMDLANCYLEDQLKQRCVEIIMKSITTDNVVTIYYSAEKYNSLELMDSCVEYFRNNINDNSNIETHLKNVIKLINK